MCTAAVERVTHLDGGGNTGGSDSEVAGGANRGDRYEPSSKTASSDLVLSPVEGFCSMENGP